MTTRYRPGDEVTLHGRVVDVSEFPRPVLRIDLQGKQKFWIPADLVEFNAHGLRHLRPGDRAVCDDGTELIWLGEQWWNVHEQTAHVREMYSFDVRPEAWKHIPRAEAMADD